MTVLPGAVPAGSTTVNPAVLMTGVFTRVGGQRHEQIFRLNLTAARATVSGGRRRELYEHCITAAAVLRPGRGLVNADMTPDLRGDDRLPADGDEPRSRPAAAAARAPGPCDAAIALPGHRRPSSPATSGSTTPAATRCSRSPPTPRRSSRRAPALIRQPGAACDRARGRAPSRQPGLGDDEPRPARRSPARTAGVASAPPTCSGRRPGSGSPRTTRRTRFAAARRRSTADGHLLPARQLTPAPSLLREQRSEAEPGRPAERLPAVPRLGQPVRDDPEHGGVVAHAQMAGCGRRRSRSSDRSADGRPASRRRRPSVSRPRCSAPAAAWRGDGGAR